MVGIYMSRLFLVFHSRRHSSLGSLIQALVQPVNLALKEATSSAWLARRSDPQGPLHPHPCT